MKTQRRVIVSVFRPVWFWGGALHLLLYVVQHNVQEGSHGQLYSFSVKDGGGVKLPPTVSIWKGWGGCAVWTSRLVCTDDTSCPRPSVQWCSSRCPAPVGKAAREPGTTVTDKASGNRQDWHRLIETSALGHPPRPLRSEFSAASVSSHGTSKHWWAQAMFMFLTASPPFDTWWGLKIPQSPTLVIFYDPSGLFSTSSFIGYSSWEPPEITSEPWICFTCLHMPLWN